MIFKDEILKDKVAVITGGGTGIGKAIAQQFASLGSDIVIASRSMEHLEPTAEELRKTGRRVLAIQMDVRRPKQIERMVEQTVEEFGKIDILINNAAGNFICRAEELSVGGWTVVIDIALNGVFFCSSIVGRQMIKQNNGRIVNISATYAWTGGPGTIHSACAKAGVETMTKTLAVEWAKHNIKINSVAAGPVDTEGAAQRLWPSQEVYEKVKNSIPLRRFGDLEDVTTAVTYLVSDAGDYITGATLVVDGGGWLSKGMFG